MTKPSITTCRTILGIFFVCLLLLISNAAHAGVILMEVDSLDGKGVARIGGFEKCFRVNSLSFSLEREIADSAKTGTDGLSSIRTPDIAVSKSMDASSNSLLKAMFSGIAVKSFNFYFVDTSSAYLAYKLEECFLKNLNTAGDADSLPNEQLLLSCSKIAVQHRPPGGKLNPPEGWDFQKNVKYDPGAILTPDGKPSQ